MFELIFIKFIINFVSLCFELHWWVLEIQDAPSVNGTKAQIIRCEQIVSTLLAFEKSAGTVDRKLCLFGLLLDLEMFLFSFGLWIEGLFYKTNLVFCLHLLHVSDFNSEFLHPSLYNYLLLHLFTYFLWLRVSIIYSVTFFSEKNIITLAGIKSILTKM